MNRPACKGLSQAERRGLVPVGPPGEYVSNETLAGLVRDQRGRWVEERPGRSVFEPTEFGVLALRVCPPQE